MCRSVLLALLGVSLGLINAFPTEQPDGGKNWVVIVAGSNGWYNYRHQVRGAQQGNCCHNVTLSCVHYDSTVSLIISIDFDQTKFTFR